MNASLCAFFWSACSSLGRKKANQHRIVCLAVLGLILSAICHLPSQESPENRTGLRLQGYLQCHFMFSSVTMLTSHSFSCSKLLINPAPSGSPESPEHWFHCSWLPWDITQADFGLLLLWFFVCRTKMAGAYFNLTVEASAQLPWQRTMKLVRFNAKLM